MGAGGKGGEEKERWDEMKVGREMSGKKEREVMRDDMMWTGEI